MLGTMNLNIDMILSTLSISSHYFTFGFLKILRTNGNSVLHLYTHDLPPTILNKSDLLAILNTQPFSKPLFYMDMNILDDS